jgi:hypothetical protein
LRRDINEVVIHEHVIRDVGGSAHIIYPIETSTNYIEWAQVMQINLRAQKPLGGYERASRTIVRTCQRSRRCCKPLKGSYGAYRGE